MTNAKQRVALRATLYDAEGRDREVEVRPGLADELGEHHLLWIDVDGRDADAIATLVEPWAARRLGAAFWRTTRPARS